MIRPLTPADRQALQASAEAALQAAREADTDDLSRQFLALARELERLAKETK